MTYQTFDYDIQAIRDTFALEKIDKGSKLKFIDKLIALCRQELKEENEKIGSGGSQYYNLGNMKEEKLLHIRERITELSKKHIALLKERKLVDNDNAESAAKPNTQIDGFRNGIEWRESIALLAYLYDRLSVEGFIPFVDSRDESGHIWSKVDSVYSKNMIPITREQLKNAYHEYGQNKTRRPKSADRIDKVMELVKVAKKTSK